MPTVTSITASVNATRRPTVGRDPGQCRCRFARCAAAMTRPRGPTAFRRAAHARDARPDAIGLHRVRAGDRHAVRERAHLSPRWRGNECGDYCCAVVTCEPAPPPTLRADRMTLPVRESSRIDLLPPASYSAAWKLVPLGSRVAVRELFPQVRGGRCRSSAARAKCRLHNGFHRPSI